MRRYLEHHDPSLVAVAVGACGSLGDDGAVPVLIRLLEHSSERVRAGAFDALERITGLAFGKAAERWSSWHVSEVRWWETKAESLLIRVEHGHGLEFVRASREALEHRLYRDRIAQAFARALQNGRGDERLLACRALAQLRSPMAVPSLVECLEREDPKLRESAWQALRAITGAELPAESDSWAAFAG